MGPAEANCRDRFINYVLNGGVRPFVSLQIGAGAGFDCRLAGKRWNSEGTLADTIRAYDIVECDALYNVGLPEFGQQVPELNWQTRTEMAEGARVTHRWLETPYGQLRSKFHELEKTGITPITYPISIDDGLDAVCWYADQYHKAIPYIPELIGPLIEQVRPHGPISIQWNIQPFEMFGLASVPDMVMHAMAHPKRYRAICDQIRDVNIEMIQEVFRCGADFVFLGSPGSEMMSPRLYEEFIVPDSWAISRSVHEAGGLVYCHICSPIEPFLSMGCFNHMGIDLFETLSPPPVGDVEDLARARQVLARQICTRGNVGLDVLLKGTAADVERATIAVLEATAGYKHMVAASDYLFYDVPLENVKTVVNTVKGYS